MVSILKPRAPQRAPAQKETGRDTIDKILVGLNIAQSAFGIKANYDKINALGDTRDAKEKLAAGDFTPAQAVEFESKHKGAFVPGEGGEADRSGFKIGGLESAFKRAPTDEDKPFGETKAGKEFIAKKRISAKFDSEKLAAELKGGNKELSQATIKYIDEGNLLPGLLDDLGTQIEGNKDLFGPVSGRIGSVNPFDTQSQVFNSDIRSKAQAFGRFMEGGVLRKEDELKYEKMFPALSDRPDVAAGKLVIVKDLLDAKQESLTSAFKAQGFNLAGLGKKPQAAQQQQKKGGGLLDALVPSAQAAPPDLNAASDEDLDSMLMKLYGGR